MSLDTAVLIVVGVGAAAIVVVASGYLVRRAIRAVRGMLEIGQALVETQRQLRDAHRLLLDIGRELRDSHRELLESQRSVQEVQHVLPDALRGIHASTQELCKTSRLAGFYQRPIVREHMAALESIAPPAAGASVVSLQLSQIAERLDPVCLQEGGGQFATAVCTVAIGADFRERVRPCLQSQQEYAARHGLAYCVLEQTDDSAGRPPSWMKVPLLLHLLSKGYRRILYIDADAMITDMNVDVAPQFDRLERELRAILMSEDEAGVNAGVFFVRHCEAAFRLLDLLWLNDVDIHHGHWEQNALKVQLDASNAVRATLLIEPNAKLFNSFPIERGLGTRASQLWSPGDFVCHFSGMRSPDLERVISHYRETIAAGLIESLQPGAAVRP